MIFKAIWPTIKDSLFHCDDSNNNNAKGKIFDTLNLYIRVVLLSYYFILFFFRWDSSLALILKITVNNGTSSSEKKRLPPLNLISLFSCVSVSFDSSISIPLLLSSLLWQYIKQNKNKTKKQKLINSCKPIFHFHQKV